MSCVTWFTSAMPPPLYEGNDLNSKNLLQPRIVDGNMEWIQEPRQRRPIFRGKHDGQEDSHEVIDVSANIGRRGT
jgi:hypothetical protein